MRLRDKVAVITASGRVMGAAIARRFADKGEKGTQLVVNYISQHRYDGILQELRAMGAEVASLRCDHTRWQEAGALVRVVLEAFGWVDIVVDAVSGTKGDLYTPFIYHPQRAVG